MESIITEKKSRNEEVWNADLIEIIKSRLMHDFPEINVIKGKILKDIFLHTDNKNGNYSLQFGFVDQDIIIYEKTMDISDLDNSDHFILHKNNNPDANKLIIPKIICELKYNGIATHGLVIYSDYAADIKSIFPDCKYFLALRYKKSSTPNKLLRHGKNFDKIIAFEDGKSKAPYKKGDFENQLEHNSILQKKFNDFIKIIKMELEERQPSFIK